MGKSVRLPLSREELHRNEDELYRHLYETGAKKPKAVARQGGEKACPKQKEVKN